MKKTIHIISHSHLDREWYMPYERHRYNTVRLIDDILNQKEKDPLFKSFHLDGQVIPIHDYLEIKPEQKERLLEHIKKGTIQIGPWYILQDCFLTSAEANVRNMQIGLYESKRLQADPVRIGYFPDTFGNISQVPQILKKFNIDVAAFGRGLNEVGFDNQIVKQYGINQSELIWQAPDGSEVSSIFFANWYCNACDIPFTNEDDIVEFFKGVIAKAEKFTKMNDLLALNGCDHLPLRKNIGSIIKLLNERIPEYNFIHSNFKDFVEIVKENKKLYSDRVVKGEINGQFTSGYHLLVNTASTRVDVKWENYIAQNRLEKEAEPISAINYIFSGLYDENELLYSWKMLLQDHPHDSICSCSIDEVNSEVLTRFKKSQQVSTVVRDEAFYNLSNLIKNDTDYEGILVVNKFPYKATTNASATVSFDRKDKVKEIEIIDQKGRVIPANYKVKRNAYTYRIPKDRFREVAFKDVFKIDFLAEDMPPLGYSLFYVRPVESKKKTKVVKTSKILENDHLKIDFNLDGTFNMLNKESNNFLKNLNYFEYTCDIGEEYNYRQSTDKLVITSKGKKAKIEKIEDNDARQIIKVTTSLDVPKERADQEASKEYRTLNLSYLVILYRDHKYPIVKLKIENNIKDYRLRAVFDTHINTKHVYSEGQFDLVKRNIHPWQGWMNPSRTDRFDNFVLLKDKENEFLVSSKGLHEYEVIRQQENNPLALTLIRAVGEMGDFGFFPTPDAQLQKEVNVEYMIELFSPKKEKEYLAEAYKFKARRFYGYQVPKQNKGKLEPDLWLLDNKNLKIQLSAFKKAFQKEGLIARFYSISTTNQKAKIKLNTNIIKKAYLTNLNEEVIEELSIEKGCIVVDFKPKEIQTIHLTIKD